MRLRGNAGAVQRQGKLKPGEPVLTLPVEPATPFLRNCSGNCQAQADTFRLVGHKGIADRVSQRRWNTRAVIDDGNYAAAIPDTGGKPDLTTGAGGVNSIEHLVEDCCPERFSAGSQLQRGAAASQADTSMLQPRTCQVVHILEQCPQIKLSDW